MPTIFKTPYEKPRSSIVDVLHAYGLRKGVGVEIGVKRGEFSKVLLDAWDCESLILVDAWKDQTADVYDELNVHDHDDDYAACMRTLEPYKGRYHVLRGFSHEVVDKVNDATLDFVYIDANHSYDAVMQDLRDWYPKLKPGGIIAGDDYTIKPLEQINTSSVFGVKKAVDEFVLEHKKNVSIDLEGVWYYTSKEESGTAHYIACRNWWFVK